MSADEPITAKLWRSGGVLVSLVWPALLVWLSAPTVGRAVSGGVADSFAPRLHAASDDLVLLEDIRSQISSAALDRTLIVYFGIAALVAVVGAALRAFAHGAPSPTLKGADFAGKCLALSGAVIAFAGAWSRVGDAGVLPYIPASFVWIAVGGGILALVVVWIFGSLDAEAKS